MRAFWRDKRVFITGHTGFKGGWLALWLSRLGARVHGYALAPPTDPSFFELTGLEARLDGHVIGDIRDAQAMRQAMALARPEIVFHLAAQPLVRDAYGIPIETLETNVMGTAYLLEAVRQVGGVRAVVVITTDKCYENREWPWPYREVEPLGGHDPYSASKAAAELVTASYRASFFGQDGDCAIATARAGNVIGGGDFARDRLLPDMFRAHQAGQPVRLRSPRAVRPWQHVLEPLNGYLTLARRLFEEGARYAGAWNFGPWEQDSRTVQWITEFVAARLPGFVWELDQRQQPHEAQTLRLDSSKARQQLAWAPVWDLEQAINKTLEWHLAQQAGEDLAKRSECQIRLYEEQAWGG